MNSICCESPWCNCGSFEQHSNKPPCADKERHPHSHECCCCCHCHDDRRKPVRHCRELPVEPFCNSCGCSIRC